jgi:hypothetical protein
VVVPAIVSSELCACFLNLSSTDYLKEHKRLKKEGAEARNLKTDCSMKFQNFKGTFRVRSLLGSDPQVSSNDDEATSLLLLGFHNPED